MQFQRAAEEVKRPQRDLPIGIIASLLICTVLYIVVSLILTGIVPYGQLNISDPVAFALQFIGQDGLAGVISVGAITGITTMLVMMCGQVRVSYAMSRMDLLPKRVLLKVHPKFKTHFKYMDNGNYCGTYFRINRFKCFSTSCKYGDFVSICTCSCCCYCNEKNSSDLPKAFKAPLVPFLPALTVIFCLYLMLQLSGTAWISFGVWMVIGIAVYFLYSRKHSALNNSKEEEDVANL